MLQGHLPRAPARRGDRPGVVGVGYWSKKHKVWSGTRYRCNCWGYWFPHRKGGGACEHSPRRDFYLARRAGATVEEAMQELSVDQLERMFPLRV